MEGSILEAQAFWWTRSRFALGGGEMDHERFRDWLSRVDELTEAQRKEVAAVLSNLPEGAASLAAIELGVDD